MAIKSGDVEQFFNQQLRTWEQLPLSTRPSWLLFRIDLIQQYIREHNSSLTYQAVSNLFSELENNDEEGTGN